MVGAENGAQIDRRRPVLHGADHATSGRRSVLRGEGRVIPVRPVGLSRRRRLLARLVPAHPETLPKTPAIQPALQPAVKRAAEVGPYFRGRGASAFCTRRIIRNLLRSGT